MLPGGGNLAAVAPLVPICVVHAGEEEERPEPVLPELPDDLPRAVLIEDGKTVAAGPPAVVFPAREHGNDRSVDLAAPREEVLAELRVVGAGASARAVVGADLADVHVRPVLPPRGHVAPLGERLRAPWLPRGPLFVLVGRVAPAAPGHTHRHRVRAFPRAVLLASVVGHNRELVPAQEALRPLRHAQRHRVARRVATRHVYACRPVLVSQELRREISRITQRHAKPVAPALRRVFNERAGQGGQHEAIVGAPADGRHSQ